MIIQDINALLARWHYLNSPYISASTAVIILSVGLFVMSKNLKSRQYRVFFTLNFLMFFWFLCNALSMAYFNNRELALLWWRIGYTVAPFLAVSYYHFGLATLKKKSNILLYSLYCIAILEDFYLWVFNDIKIGAYAIANVGMVWQGMPRFSYFILFGMAKYTIITLLTAFSVFGEYKKQTIPFKKNQSKSLAIVFFVLVMGWTEWLPGFDVRLHIAWAIVPFFIATIAYAIIRYKAMEFDTVIHRTILWLTTILLLVLPWGIIGIILKKLALPNSVYLFVLVIYLLIFITYYTRLRPHIDHLFRRRKYDYYQILGEIGEKIGTELNINNVITRLFKELKEVLYIRNGLILVQQLGQQDYTEAGSIGYDTLQDISNDRQGGVLYSSALSKWLNEHQKALEREQIEIDPQYEPIKQEALTWLNQNMLEIIIPIVMEDKVKGLIGIGKKENLQAYTAKDIELLEKMGGQLGATIDNALHHEDIVEKERLDEELKLGREIQMTLLPRQIPSVPHLFLQGMMTPAKEIGGDYYDFITIPNKEELVIVIGDVSGKGVAAGLLMSMVKATIHALSQEGASPKQILLRTNAFLYQNIGGQKFMTLLYLKWQSQSNTLTYSSAGHEHILIYRADHVPAASGGDTAHGQVEAIVSGGFMLGMIPDIETFLEEKEIKLELGDKILLYTDGVTEAENQRGDRFGLPHLMESFQRHSQKPAGELMQAVKDETYAFIGAHPQYDDITLVVMEAT